MTLLLRPHAELVPPSPGDVPVTTAVGAHGEAVILWSSPEGRSALLDRVGGTAMRSQTASPVAARVTVQHNGSCITVPIERLSLAFPRVQSLPSGAILVVGARERTGRPNAQVYDHHGALAQEARVGDAVAHVAATPAGNVWLAYRDDDRLSRHGLVRLGPDLVPNWTLPAPAARCSALNVHGETAWASHDPDFPIVRVAGDRLTSWRNQVSGSAAILVGGEAVALVGGTSVDRERIVLGQLTGTAFEPVGQTRLALPAEAHLHGRDDALHVFTGTTWYRLDLDDVM